MEDLHELLEQTVSEGMIEIECPTCGLLSRTEPDGEGFCDNCKRVINNPLMAAGLI